MRSLDIFQKLRLRRYSGGYATLQQYVFPYLRTKNVFDKDIRYVMIKNPKRLLTFVEPQMPMIGANAELH